MTIKEGKLTHIHMFSQQQINIIIVRKAVLTNEEAQGIIMNCVRNRCQTNENLPFHEVEQWQRLMYRHTK